MKEDKIETSENPEKASQQLHIHIERYQDLLEILEDKRKVWRLASIVLITGVALFLGIALLVLQLKKSFTYSDITTNAFGTTTIADEQKQVSYFLFNTAELWANSGISVEKGDVISIYASGAAHTAIHKLYEASKNNTYLNEKYFDSNGERLAKESKRDSLRSKYRIFPEMPQSALIMQVSNEVPFEKNKFAFRPDSASQDCFYYIGGKREKIHIRQDGVLFFAINDIVLDSLTIVKMMLHNYHYLAQDASLTLREAFKKLPSLDSVEKKNLKKYIALLDSLERVWSKEKDYYNCLCRPNSFKFGGYAQKDIAYDPNHTKTEMNYYLEKKYKQAWFDDNIGSFLIVIEKENSNLRAHGK